MALSTDKWPRMALPVATLLLSLSMLAVVGEGSSSAAPTQQSPVPTPPSPNPASPPSTKPILLTDPVPNPNQAGVLWFSSTGHTLRGVFLDYWQQNGGLAQFGYPLTEEFFEEVGTDRKQYRVQYFERNRFELHPENTGTQYEVLLGTLGVDFRKADPPAPQQPNAQYFPQTGHNLSGKFLDYWQSHGGLAVNGYPITEPAMERSTNGKEYLVQWFERSRMELHPENAGSPYEVLLGVLGRQLSEKKGYPYGWYPRYGYAIDYSWVAGYLLSWRACGDAECECPLIAYRQPDYIRPWGPGWTDATEGGAPNYLVLFGHRQSNAEQDPICKPNYRVDEVQQNPADTHLP